MAKPRRQPKGRNADSYTRRGRIIPPKARVLIVCEGEKTEPNYLKGVIRKLRVPTAKVRIHGEGGSAPISVVEYAEKLLRKDPDIEKVYLVFDRDRHTTYDQAIIKATAINGKEEFVHNDIQLITSVPCFEVWLLLHVAETAKPYGKGTEGDSPAKRLIKDLKKHREFSGYEKSKTDWLEVVWPLTEKAVVRAKSQVQQGRKNGVPAFHEDSSSRIFTIIQELTNISKS